MEIWWRLMKPKPRAKLYPVLVQCVEEGAAFGVHRAFKHVDHPAAGAICEHVEREILNLLCERLDLGKE